VVVNVGSTEDMSNRAVHRRCAAARPAAAGLPYLLQPRVVNTSKTENADVTLSVLIEDKE